MQKIKRFARFWDLYYNSGNFSSIMEMVWRDGDVYRGFFDFSEWIYKETQSTWKISLDRLSELLFDYLTKERCFQKDIVAQAIFEDVYSNGLRKIPKFLREFGYTQERGEKSRLDGFIKRQSLRGED